MHRIAALRLSMAASVLFEAVNDHLGAKPFASFHKLQVLRIIAMSNIRAAMPVEGRKAAYFVGKAASQLPPGYITEEFLRKLAAATGYSILGGGFHPERTGSGAILSHA
jgi:hypothetical protein